MFPISSFEVQLTASNDGEFLRAHTDSDNGPLRTRTVTFVYYCHREPRRFEGGELRIFGRDTVSGQNVLKIYNVVQPIQNSVVFFPSESLHEIAPVVCPSHSFNDSRFTLNGWLHR